MSISQQADGLLGAAVERGDVPGVAAMVSNGNETLYQGAFGERELGGGDPMRLDTVIAIASMTKAVTATAAMQLVEQGALELDAPAGDIVPYLGEVGVLEGFDGDGQPITRPPKPAITLRNLLTHTAGFGYEIWNQEILDFQAATGSPSTRTRSLASLKTPLLFEPGSQWNYGISIDWAGQMIEAVSGQRLGEYMRANIFEPLGMNSSGYHASPEMKTRLATIHLRGEDGALSVPEDNTLLPEPEIDTGGGGLLSSVEDYTKFVRMILNNGACDGGRILAPDTVAMMSANHMGDCRVTPMLTTAPYLSNDVEFFPGVAKAWGLSFMINLEQAPTGRSAGSLAWAGLTNAYYWIDPVKDLAGVYATQIFPFGDKLSLPLFLEFEKSVYDSVT
ncbi:MAG: serine hydrolase domain-containing protein [Alphaproteobacteria bacterium]|jgi:CubicO group peptidase (beta-lactamase class C family)|nr:serine hydrolase domain-containing protein [Alphaproteobacteria bacterium]